MEKKAKALEILRRQYEDLPTTVDRGLFGDPGRGTVFAWDLTPVPADILGMDPAEPDQWVLRCVTVPKYGEARAAGSPFEGTWPTEAAAREHLVTLGHLVALLTSSDARVIVPTEARADLLATALVAAGWMGAHYREPRPDGVLFQLGRLPSGRLPRIYSVYDAPPPVVLRCDACGMLAAIGLMPDTGCRCGGTFRAFHTDRRLGDLEPSEGVLAVHLFGGLRFPASEARTFFEPVRTLIHGLWTGDLFLDDPLPEPWVEVGQSRVRAVVELLSIQRLLRVRR